MQIILDERFQKSIENNLNNVPKEANMNFMNVKKLFPLDRMYVLGGFVRDSILRVLYNYNFPINDLDLLIDDARFDDVIRIFHKENISRFGGLKFKYPGFSMDVFSMNNVFFLKDKPELDKNLENVLRGCDLSTSALGYNLDTRVIYSVGAMEDIHERRINVINHSYMEAAPTISRLILHSDKMGFKIEESGIDYIRRNYSTQLDKKIIDFLNYKEVGHLFSLIKKNIELILF
jgi:tRNA nucleotidyltransferase/poly(A) polymerase